MPDVTIAPSDEACQAIVDRINAGTTYTLPVPATYGRVIFADMETITGFSCDVVHLSEQQLNETLDAEDSTQHTLMVWVRDKLPDQLPATIAARMLIFRQIFQQLNTYRNPSQRVTVWQCGDDDETNPDKELLEESNLFEAGLRLVVEVKPPA
jgi:hypothetical protein